MTVGTLAVTGMPRALARWIKLCGLALIAAACWWLLSVVDDERYLTPAVIVQWLEDAGSLAPLLLIVSMAGAVVIPPIPSIPLDLAAGAAFGPFLGTIYAVLGAELGAIGAFLIARAVGRETLSRYLKANAAEVLERLAERREPLVITQNGEAKAVLQDVASYEETQETLALLKILAMGASEVQAGKVKPVADVVERLRAKRSTR